MIKECKICTNTFDFCPSCGTKYGAHKASGFCSKSCYEISIIMQRYGSNVSTVENTIIDLDAQGIDDKHLQPKIKSYYENIVNKFNEQTRKQNVSVPVVEVAPQESVEVVIEYDEDTTASEDEE